MKESKWGKEMNKSDFLEDIYVVFEGGGVDYSPLIHGIFGDMPSAKECIKNVLSDFCRGLQNLDALMYEFLFIDKKILENYIYFFVYADEDDVQYGDYMNSFVIAKI